MLCHPALNGVLGPLLMAQADELCGSSLQEKVSWFRQVLSTIKTCGDLWWMHDDDDQHVVVRRNNILQSLCEHNGFWKPRMFDGGVEFEGESGMGIGLSREFFALFAGEIANENYNLFSFTDTDPPKLVFATCPCFDDDRESYLEMAGRIIGLALLHEQHIQVQFAVPVLKLILAQELCSKDLCHVEPEIYRAVRDLGSYTAEQLVELGLDFTVDECKFGKRRKVDLLLDGASIAVTPGNLEVYQRLYMHHCLSRSTWPVSIMKHGLHQFCPEALLTAAAKCFTVEEFDLLISGPREVDIDDWQLHTRYENCSAEHLVIHWFWEEVRMLPNAKLHSLLRFATGRSSAPIGGFKMLKSRGYSMPFTIALQAPPSADNMNSNFPRSQTCGHQLRLPCYASKQDLARYLRLATDENMFAFEEAH